jgi:mannose-6-phosphate isomerase-like protein (cupin superfamily)
MEFNRLNCAGVVLVALALNALTKLSAQSPAPVPARVIEVVQIERQPWYEADDKAVAREIASPRNSRARQMSIADIIIPAGVAVKPHYHKVIEEIYYVTGGQGVMIIDGVEQKIGVGDAVVIRPGERHSVRNDSKAELRLIVTCTPAWTPDCLIFN